MVGKSKKAILKKTNVNTVKSYESVRYNPIAKEEKLNEEKVKDENVKELKTYHKNPLSDLIPQYDIYVFNLAPPAVENDLWRLFGPFGALKNVAIVRDPETKEHKGFGFVTMKNKDEAAQAIEMLNGHALHGRPLKISFKNEKRSDEDDKFGERGAYHIYIFNLSPKTMEISLWKLFGSFGAVKNVTIMRDLGTNFSKGYAFVTMKNLQEAQSAISKLNNFKLDGRNLRVSFKGHRNDVEDEKELFVNNTLGNFSQDRGENIPLYINNLAPCVEEDSIRELFSEFGTVNDVNIVRDLSTLQCKGYGFVMMKNADEAKSAIDNLDGFMFENKTLQVNLKSEKKIKT